MMCSYSSLLQFFTSNCNCCSGKRQAISIAPMAPLQKVIEAFCFQQKQQLDVSGCQLVFQKQVLDPTTPVRFANLPKEAKLELIADTGTIIVKCIPPEHAHPNTALHTPMQSIVHYVLKEHLPCVAVVHPVVYLVD